MCVDSLNYLVGWRKTNMEFDLLTIVKYEVGGWVRIAGIDTGDWEGSLFCVEWGQRPKFDLLWMRELVRGIHNLMTFGR